MTDTTLIPTIDCLDPLDAALADFRQKVDAFVQVTVARSLEAYAERSHESLEKILFRKLRRSAGFQRAGTGLLPNEHRSPAERSIQPSSNFNLDIWGSRLAESNYRNEDPEQQTYGSPPCEIRGIPGRPNWRVDYRVILVTTTTSGNFCRLQYTSNEPLVQPFQISAEVKAGWQLFLEALATRIVREERERLQTRKGE
jgi:hypothetical protein